MALVNQAMDAIASGIATVGNHTAKAAARANGISSNSANTSANFNQASADNANNINAANIASQYGFNSAQAAAANQFTEYMWNKAAGYNTDMWNMTAAWNEKMFNKQMEFNAAEAQKNRDWSERMSNTQYQRAIADLKAAGLNPVLAATNGMTAGIPSGSAANVGSPSMSQSSMSGASGQMASGGLLGANDATMPSYTGQMEYMSGILGLLSAGIAGISSAAKNFGEIGISIDNGSLADIIASLIPGVTKDFKKDIEDLTNPNSIKGHPNKYDKNNMGKEGTYENNYKKRWKGYWTREGMIE